MLQPPVPEPAREQQQAPAQILTDKMKMSAPQSVLLGRSNNKKADQGRQSMATKDSESSDEKSPQFNTEAYDLISENPFKSLGDDPLSTFSVDVDTASYANIRRFAFGNELPPKDAVRIEEMVNYLLANRDFNNDSKDAGDIGAGHTVTAFYEVVPKGFKSPAGTVDPLKYQKPVSTSMDSDELMNVKLRFKKPDEEKSSLI